MLLEVIALTPEDARVAAKHGADRIEFVSAIEEGGLTPALTFIEETAAECAIPVHVMIRPHGRSFLYSEADLERMIRDMSALGKAGAGAFVLGTLTPVGTVDEEKLKRLLDAAGDIPVTFHRAFDEARNLEEAFGTLVRYPQIRTILTSGGKPSVLDAAEEIARLVRLSSGTTIEIMAGSGLTPASLAGFVDATGVRAVHFGSGVRQDGAQTAPLDSVRLAAVRAVLGGRERGRDA
ncbi:copper homeostasis protein CutC [Paenibacillus sacheonensis]|uniref:PF03932 family protein CutC n=1 Tax=Paenibacillus sacheonensis TaxID=742054 RepID=A0A7X4YLN3_9BACL|nr:copper homeostasis protein CutC [Paenibacillus sacheonensis]MBM7566042.1 copper homeostasis protein [Paenibacillus sacheonensis]NBC68647.1 copper homeostasis protein CutC [Paenibacillus sacheonensis]